MRLSQWILKKTLNKYKLCVCVRVCVRACVHVRVCVSVCVRVRTHKHVTAHTCLPVSSSLVFPVSALPLYLNSLHQLR